MKDYRNYGFGKLLMDTLHQHVSERGITEDVLPIVKEEDGKSIVKLNLHSQVRIDCRKRLMSMI